jgi:hypothetical protein
MPIKAERHFDAIETKETTMTDAKIHAFYRAKEEQENARVAAKCGNHCNAFFYMQRSADLHAYSQS